MTVLSPVQSIEKGLYWLEEVMIVSDCLQAEQASYKPWQERALAGVLGAAAAASIVFAGPAEAAVQPFLSSTGKPCQIVAYCCRLVVCTLRMPSVCMRLTGLFCRSKRYHC